MGSRIAVLLVVALAPVACSGDDDSANDAPATTVPAVTNAPPLAGGDAGLTDPVDNRDRPPTEDELDPPPPPSEVCDAAELVSTASGLAIETSVGGTDPSNREFCTFGDVAEEPLVRVRVTSTDSEISPADGLATVGAESGVEQIDPQTVVAGRVAARLGDVLTEVTVLETAYPDEAEAAEVALAVLDALAPA